VRYPTRELLRCLQRKAPGKDFWLPGLTAKEAWLLTAFLDEIQEAIWLDYGIAISHYLDGKESHPHRNAAPGPVQTIEQGDIDC